MKQLWITANKLHVMRPHEAVLEAYELHEYRRKYQHPTPVLTRGSAVYHNLRGRVIVVLSLAISQPAAQQWSHYAVKPWTSVCSLPRIAEKTGRSSTTIDERDF